ncbi:MAG: hypothetical protein M1837_002311 [Sclerophora amabilis]|nr:MAG: hypothetical protein M1837_002311 [Sclerophora amabilis]
MPSHSPAGPKFEVLHQEPGKSDFVYEFQFIGTMDNSSYLCIPDAIAFREEVCGGEQKIRKYCHELAREGGKLVANALGTEVMENESGTLMECNFTNVRLPLKVISSTSSSSSSSTPPTGEETFVGAIEEKHQNGVVGWMQQKLNEEYDTFIAILFHNGNWWARLSAQIYLDLSDFEYGARVLKEACERAGQGEFLGRVDKLERGEATMEQDPS